MSGGESKGMRIQKAKNWIGNAVICFPEDLTCWLNKETMTELDRKRLSAIRALKTRNAFEKQGKQKARHVSPA